MARTLTADEARQLAAQRKTHNGGRKRREDIDNIKQSLDDALPVADVVEQLRALVKEGDKDAIKLWLAYRWGTPVQRVEASTPGSDAFVIRFEREDDTALPDAT